MNKRLVLLPMDSRPASTRLPARMAALAGFELIMPPLDILGTLDSPAARDAVFAWLDSRLEQPVDAIIISCDMIVYGGLVQSRLPDTANEITALKVFNYFRELRKNKPALKMYAFSTVLRDAITASDESSFGNWKKQMDGKSRSTVESGIIRKRNLSVNRLAVRLAGDGLFDFLVIGKEDTAAGNPHGGELESLNDDAFSFGERKTIVLSGADELACLMIARAAADIYNLTPSFFFDIEQSILETTPLYEPLSLEENLRLQVRAAGGRIASFPDCSDFVLMAHMPNVGTKQKDLFLEQIENEKSGDESATPSEKLIENLQNHLNKSRTVGLVDAENINGSSPELIESLLERQLFFRLAAYAGWNTTANSSGTVIAQCAAGLSGNGNLSQKKRLRCRFNFLTDRLLEDYLYSTKVRPNIISSTGDKLDISNREEAERILVEECDSELQKMMSTFFINRTLPVDPSGKYVAVPDSGTIRSAVFPWNRFFETIIETELIFAQFGEVAD